jgi:hypothetical protein
MLEMRITNPETRPVMFVALSVEHAIIFDFQFLHNASKTLSIKLNIADPVWLPKNGTAIKR